MNLFITQQFKASFHLQPQIGDWVIRKFYEWKCSGSNSPISFGRDEADSRPNFSNLMHAHVVPTKPEDLLVWMQKALRKTDPYYMTSNRFVLYAKHESTPSYLLIDHYIDQDPGAHERLTKYYGDVQDPFTWAMKLPENCITYVPPIKKSA